MTAPVDDPQAAIVIRPSLAAWRRSVFATGSLGPLTVLALLLASSREHVALIAGLVAVIALAALVGYWHYARSVRIIINGPAVRITSWLGRETVVQRSDIRGVALREIPGAWGRRRPLFIIYDKTHRSLAAFDRRLWPDEDVRRLEAALCRHLPESRVTSYQRLAQEFPGSVAWWQLHGTLVGVILAVVLIIVGSIVLTITDGVSRT